MTAKLRAIVELVVAAVAAIGCVLSWLAASSTVVVAPVLPTEPAKSSVVYDPTWMIIAFLLAMLAGVLAVIGIARLRR
jgi:MFS superfamily sulfate permease-like transporter